MATSWSAGTGVTASSLNGLTAGLTSYTPSLANMTIGNGTVSGYYNSSAHWTDLVIYLAAGGTTTYTSTGVTVSLPATATSVVPQNLPGKIYTGTQNFNAVLYISAGSGTGVILVPASTSATNLIAMSTASLTTGTNGNLSFVSSYWAA